MVLLCEILILRALFFVELTLKMFVLLIVLLKKKKGIFYFLIDLCLPMKTQKK